MVEFVIVIPFLFLLLVGVADYARVYSRAITIANAARAGAQFGAQNLTTSGDTASIHQAARVEATEAGTISVSSARVCRCSNGTVVNCVTGACAGYGAPQVFVAVTTGVSIATLVDYPGLPKTLPLSRTATLRVQ